MKMFRNNLRSYNFNPRILTHPNIPKPLHGLNPRSIKGKDWWENETRLLRKTVFNCQACGCPRSKAFDCHEEYDINFIEGFAKFRRIVVICRDCHLYIHLGMCENLVAKGKMSIEELERISSRGDFILSSNSIKKEEYKGAVAKWDKWKLIFEGKEYKPLFKSLEEWYSFYMENEEKDDL